MFLSFRKLVCAGADDPDISARQLILRGRDRKNLALDPCGDHAIDAVPVRLAGRIHPKLTGNDQPSPIIAAHVRARRLIVASCNSSLDTDRIGSDDAVECIRPSSRATCAYALSVRCLDRYLL